MHLQANRDDYRLVFRAARCLALIAIVATLAILVTASVQADQFSIPPRQPVEVASGQFGVVVCDTPLASQVGTQILAAGGNAVDAAVATALALAVTWPEAGNIGGGGFMMIAPPAQPDATTTNLNADSANADSVSADDVVCVEYREIAPAAVNVNSFVGWENRYHARMAGVPGTVRGLALAHQQYGSKDWKDVVEPSIQLARQGITVNAYLAYSLNKVLRIESIKTEPRYAEFRRVFSHPVNYFWAAGDRLIQTDLANTLQRIADEGADGFYLGPTAQAIAAAMQRQEGLISLQDLADYQANVRPAESVRFQGYTVYGAPPPSSGGITVLMQLQMLEALNLTADPDQFWTAQQVHLMAEVMRRAFRERAAWLGDSDFVEINPIVRDERHIQQLARNISPDRATPSESIAGGIELSAGPKEGLQTTHFSIIDASGMAVSNTYTLEQNFGCRIVPEGTGFVLNNEMGDFNWDPGVTNRRGKIGTPPNQMAPGKRMLSSQSPTIVRLGPDVKLIVGTPGGRTIINTVTQLIVQILLFERAADQAVAGPRLHHQWFPDLLKLEGGDWGDQDPNVIISRLREMGHTVTYSPGRRQGSAHVIDVNLETGNATGVADWRRGGSARAVEPIDQ